MDDPVKPGLFCYPNPLAEWTQPGNGAAARERVACCPNRSVERWPESAELLPRCVRRWSLAFNPHRGGSSSDYCFFVWNRTPSIPPSIDGNVNRQKYTSSCPIKS